MGDELGGHLLSGHVMGIASVTLIEKPTPEQSKLLICLKNGCVTSFPKGLLPLMV